MKLAMSNIAWSGQLDEKVMLLLSTLGYDAIEIAPTRFFNVEPYSHIDDMIYISKKIYEKYRLKICSMQSIWYGHKERIAESESNYHLLMEYMKKCIFFADAISCSNIVFGCPINRCITNDKEGSIVMRFLEEAAVYAFDKGVIIALEANPTIYNTNFANSTQQAIDIVRRIDNPGLKINYDVGTMIQNEESVSVLEENIDIVNHIHISEPFLNEIKQRKEHFLVKKILDNHKYDHYVSLEMSLKEDFSIIDKNARYLYEVFV